MNKILKKASFISGLFLLFSPIVFLSVFTFILNFNFFYKTFLYNFDTNIAGIIGNVIIFTIVLIVNILEVLFFIKIFNAYRLHEPLAYFIIYSLGILATIMALGSMLLIGGPTENMLFLRIIFVSVLLFFILLLFSLFSFRYQKEKFFVDMSSYLIIRKDLIILYLFSITIAIIGNFINIPVLSAQFSLQVFLFLAALLILPFIYWWRKKRNIGTLHSFIFLPSFQIVATNLVIKLIGILYTIFLILITIF